MEFMAEVLPIIIYILLIILLVIGIILGIKLIITIDKVNYIVDDITEKVESLDSFFKIINMANNKFNLVTTKISDWIMTLIGKIPLFNKKGKEEEEDYE